MRPLLTFSDRFFPLLPASSRDLRDVEKSVKNAQALYARLDELLSGGSGDSEEIGWCTNELNTLLKSIEWDIEDLSETIAIVEESPGRFKVGEPLPVPEVAASNTPCTCLTPPPPPPPSLQIGPGEIQSRKAFIAQTQRTVQVCRRGFREACHHNALKITQNKRLTRCTGHPRKHKQRPHQGQAAHRAALGGSRTAWPPFPCQSCSISPPTSPGAHVRRSRRVAVRSP